MSMSQLQIIQALSEALSWLEKEMTWGVNPSELRHLVGRIGELYVAMYTNGRMADNVNQPGYDVVSNDNERISVKTTTMSKMNGHVTFNSNSLDLVDRIIILKLDINEMELDILFDGSKEVAKELMNLTNDNQYFISLSKILKKNSNKIKTENIKAIKTVFYKNWKISELENGSIVVYTNNLLENKTYPVLRNIAQKLNIPLVNINGNLLNTRQLGGRIIKNII